MSDTPLQAQLVVWGRCGCYEFQWQDWTQVYSVFNPETGETHLISELPAAALQLIGKEGRPLLHIAADLAEACGVEMTTAWKRKVAGMLTNLEQIELVEQVSAEQY